jgi:hypothetical protein
VLLFLLSPSSSSSTRLSPHSTVLFVYFTRIHIYGVFSLKLTDNISINSTKLLWKRSFVSQSISFHAVILSLMIRWLLEKLGDFGKQMTFTQGTSDFDGNRIY